MNKNIPCYFSEVGNKNFYYPTDRRGIVSHNAEYESLPWLCNDQTLCAVKVKNKYIVSLTFEHENNIANDREKYTVVWIKKDLIMSNETNYLKD